ncbi:phage scaffolding protein [Lacrimispora celerecrescens]|uniref:Minor structural protein GP20 n=1 Tax=[Clostridium] celerecrescens 18A TaxID=1286362 RepID=A0A2M8ZAQ5_9FIRM|nr:phage scaffolding protein [Lacrimispora celerecrescens]PJJ30531.1 minor structural protein GP20 [[Clostridium] celerecrescens 18A]
MKKEEFIALGISEEQATKAAEASKKELESYVPKADYDAANQAKGQLENDIKDRDKQLETLKKNSGDNAGLQKQIETLQAENKAAKEKNEADMKELKLSTAIKVALAGSAHDVDIVTGLVDKTKLILADDGKVSGLEEQIKTIKESKTFLFKESDPGKGGTGKESGAGGYKPRAGSTNENGFGKGIAETLNKTAEAAENPYAKAWG